jgi:phosphatidylserine/phosphatidylglycerophosphate/cardiolipin synthase-like enzyme
VPAGATFNNPVGSTASQRTNLTHVIRTINSMPGFRVPQSRCSSRPALYPGTIRISLYSATDLAFANALVAASRRCISVQILMNNHLTPQNTKSIRVMQAALGTNTNRRSFAYRCSAGCRGWGVEHSKFYLFNSTLPAPRVNRITNTVMVGSSNMTANASKVQWNDLYTVRGNPSLHAMFAGQFNLMKRDRSFGRLYQLSDASGVYQATFWPASAGTPDPRLAALRSVHCTGATGGTGIRGRTVVYINMHAWFEKRGTALATQVRRLYNQGCYVRILYSFMTRAVLHQLTAGTGPRMSARRTLFSRNGVFATLYSHFKLIAVSGNVGSDSSASVVWTGSNNFTNGGAHFDEVMLRIRSAAAFNQYRNRFAFISATRSSSTWATYREPNGGGRAPAPVQETKALRASAGPAG